MTGNFASIIGVENDSIIKLSAGPHILGAVGDDAFHRLRHLKICAREEECVRIVIDTLVKVVEALDRAGIELIGDFTPSTGSGRGVRLKEIVSSARAKQFKPSTEQTQAEATNAA